ncbi:MAG TPA: cob(I)yrinic acid a,c-diamide adenosyltransferase [Pirellulaceae bacterium]|jgi:cob(I)alamin adenosyltransferase|nr:cob(I)yrinic acid a,c-diamide adenosyltransferase [Pirellulaceae bacterium]
MAKIYTRTGDDGTTGLFGGPRVRKNDLRVAAYGDVDELNSYLGIVLAGDLSSSLRPMLTQIQHELFDLGGELASPDPDQMGTRTLDRSQVERLERQIDELSAAVPPLRQFVLPGGSLAASQLHVARTVCRRAERTLLSLVDSAPDQIGPIPLVYLNRLSDWLFVAARFANFSSGVADVAWQPTVRTEGAE